MSLWNARVKGQGHSQGHELTQRLGVNDECIVKTDYTELPSDSVNILNS